MNAHRFFVHKERLEEALHLPPYDGHRSGKSFALDRLQYFTVLCIKGIDECNDTFIYYHILHIYIHDDRDHHGLSLCLFPNIVIHSIADHELDLVPVCVTSAQAFVQGV